MIRIFAWRYFKGKKSTQAIQVIAWVSMLAMAVGTAALIIVLSVFNGFESFIKNLYSNFYPEIRITARAGKTFQDHDQLLVSIRKNPSVKVAAKCLEEKMLLSYNDFQAFATLKGIDSNYDHVTDISSKIMEGDMELFSPSDMIPVTMGIGVSNRLGAGVEAGLPIKAYSFKGAGSLTDPASAYQSQLLSVRGVFMLQEDIDNQYVLAPLTAIQSLVEKPNALSSIEISLNKGAKANEVKQQLQQALKNDSLQIETRFEQNKTLYFILSSERWFVYAFLTLILCIASFNMVGSLSMLVIEKEKDIAILKAMGMMPGQIAHIFLSTGILLATIGAGMGALIALVICLLQQHFGFVKLGSGDSFLVDAYPVELHVADFVLVMGTVVCIAAIASLIPSRKAAQKAIELRVK
jgi:lipoprotein-releasing system permease protein